MRFVWITKDVPFNPDTGQLIYSNGLIQSLLANGATAVIVAYGRSGSEFSCDGLAVRSIERGRQKPRAFSLFSTLHSDAYRLRTTRFRDTLISVLQDPADAVVIDYFAMAWTVPLVRKALRHGVKRPVLVYVAHNYEAAVRREVAQSMTSRALRCLLMLDAAKAARLERSAVSGSDLVVAITEDDEASLRKLCPGTATTCITPGYSGEVVEPRPITGDTPRRAVIVGSFDWIAKQSNLRSFLNDAAPRFQRAGVKLRIVGRGPDAFIRELSHKHPFCEFTGRVDDIRPWICESRVGIMPDATGGGFKLKYLDYVFNGLPIAAFASQLSGLPIDVTRDVIVGKTAEELANGVIAAIDDLPRLEAMRLRCWQSCARAFEWTSRGKQLLDAVAQASPREMQWENRESSDTHLSRSNAK